MDRHTRQRLTISWRHRAIVRLSTVLVVLGFAAAGARGADYAADPADYRARVRQLRAGDTLHLAPGEYREGLDLWRLSGRADAPISIVGAPGPRRSVFVAAAARNTISIVDSAYLRVADLELRGSGAVVDAVKAEHRGRFAHHITLERLRIVGYDANQQIVAISTKCPAWNWTIRRNVIIGAGTGMYLGDSDGSAPFIRSVIEGNVVSGTRGYSIQIKHQNAWPRLHGPVDGPRETIIRYNTLRKDARSSRGALARPNLLLGHWPLRGRGSSDRYVVYGNLVVDNPTEALVQAEGNVTLYNNVLVNRTDDAIVVREHKDLPRSIDIFHNTVVARGIGILVRNGDPMYSQVVTENAIYSAGVRPVTLAASNFLRPYDDAGTLLEYLKPASGVPVGGPRFDVHEQSIGDTPDRSALPDASLDFDRRPRRRDVAGAYAGDEAPSPRLVEQGSPIERRSP